MSNPSEPNDPVAPDGARSDSATAGASAPAASVPIDPVRTKPLPPRPGRPGAKRPQARSGGGGAGVLALLLALIAMVLAGYVGWRQWQQRIAPADTALTALQQRVDKLESTVSGVRDERASLDQQLSDAAGVNHTLREQLLGQAQRLRQLENAVASLAEQNLSGHDAMLLDETESLLRMAAQRYTLFHDAHGAAAAYGLAEQSLAAVNDGAFAGLRQSIEAERQALARSAPVSQAGALQQLAALRGTIDTLPLKPINPPDTAKTPSVWSRIGHALAGVIKVQRDDGSPLAVADARFARELTKLDLAQAQAALLAYDGASYAAALQRVEASLSAQFDPAAAAVQRAHETVQQLAAQQSPKAPVALGEALTELRDLRAVHALSSNTTTTGAAATPATPATPGSVAAPAQERP